MKKRPEEHISLKTVEPNINNNKSISLLFLRNTSLWIALSLHGLFTAFWTLISRKSLFDFLHPIVALFLFTLPKSTHLFQGGPNSRHGTPRVTENTPGIYAFLPGGHA
ncbi:hypothetical protein [Acidovorax sp. CCYZU-2555]|uniref:hypothetical protein n=1 Tax=Acidovorax sp. CCYZU-2555 TaxID=2835042 RepID=UPI001BCE278C|nr:hypothetical protein [Acidovorax sp. CCYZU-2555]MBS7777103.1 hypothetical protein [Acidovorax sp. CCYZU-2555]